MATAVVAGRRDRSRPANRVLLPQWSARLFGLAALCTVGALQWQRLVEGLGTQRVLLWVLAAVGAAVAVLLVSAPPRRSWRLGPRARAVALFFVVLAAGFAGYLLSGLELWYLRPRHWDELLSGLGGGLQALGTVRLPYASADPWPRIVLELLGCQLLILAGLLTFWPRVVLRTGERALLQVPERGYPFVALAVMIVVVASPIVSIGGTRPAALGLTIAALAVCFLWLERLPLRPGLGVVGLLAVALFGALPVALTADRGQPWFDYRAFAESLGPEDPVRFSWTQSYGPINWPRDGSEVMRVVSGDPLYWKARNLDVFNGSAWEVRKNTQDTSRFPEPWEADLPEGWQDRSDWTDDIEIFVKRVQTTDVIGAGTTMGITESSSIVRPGFSPGTWDAPNGLKRNDSYRARVHVPNPQGDEVEEATVGENEQQGETRMLTVPFQSGQGLLPPRGAFGSTRPVGTANVYFAPFGSMEPDYATYPRRNRIERSVDEVMARSRYERTWELVKRIKARSDTALDYIRAVDAYLHRPEFRYEERPPAVPAGVEPLDFFINESHLGYCQHYAGAMALMLRMGGIPARVATGFSPGGYSESKKAWIVRDTDAHAWVEVWFDQFGWVTVDPTPSATPARSRVASSITAAPVADPSASDSGDDSSDSAGGGGGGGQAVRPDLQTGTSSATTTAEENSGWSRLLWLALIVAVLALVLAAVLFIRRPRGATPMDRAIAEVEDALRRVGRPVSTGTTLHELERRLGSHSPEVATYLRALAAGRYAPESTPPSPAGRRALRRALAQGLGFGGRLRALWALPPRVERGWARSEPRTFEADATVRA